MTFEPVFTFPVSVYNIWSWRLFSHLKIFKFNVIEHWILTDWFLFKVTLHLFSGWLIALVPLQLFVFLPQNCPLQLLCWGCEHSLVVVVLKGHCINLHNEWMLVFLNSFTEYNRTIALSLVWLSSICLIGTAVMFYVSFQFEAPEMREMKMILDGQNEIYFLVKTIGTKLDEVVGRQEKELSLLSIINQRPGHDQKVNLTNSPIQVCVTLGWGNVWELWIGMRNL